MTDLVLSLLAQTPPPPLNTTDGLVWSLLIGCGAASVLIFIWLFRVTSRSSKQLHAEIDLNLKELKQVHLDAQKRMSRLDIEIIDKLRSLSPKGAEAHSMAKQIIAKISGRILDAERCLEVGALADLVSAQEILSNPIDNSGTQYDAIKFSDTILTLQPDQFGFALQMMTDLVEADLTRPVESASFSHIPTVVSVPASDRQRRFTIRGFFKSLKG